MLSQKSIQEILDTAKVEDVVGDFVQLKRSGSNMKGLCPFHHEKTPSFMVSPAKNIYKCFGCGKGGDPVHFVMELENLQYYEALRWIAKRYNIEIEEIQNSNASIEEKQLLDSLFVVNQFALEYYQQQLFQSDLGKNVGLTYFKERGFREESIKKFGLGFAPSRKNDFTDYATKKGHKLALLQKAGLTTAQESDFFKNRVIFPIHSLTGKPLAFAGRILGKDTNAPKYLNSPETDIYHKSKTLYGLFQAKQAIRQLDECIMVEGYTDVISLHQGSIQHAVASSGTSLTSEQVSLIKRFTQNIKFLYDGDAAGIKAAMRGLDLVLAQDMNVQLVLLPDKEDPDSYLQRVGATAFLQYIQDNAKDFILFKTDLLLQETQDDPIKKAKLVREIVESIAQIPDHFKRANFLRACAAKMKMNEQALIFEMNKIIKKNYAQEDKKGSPAQDTENPINSEKVADAAKNAFNLTTTHEFQEKDIIRLLIEFGNQEMKGGEITVAQFVLENVEEILDDFDNALYGKIARECLEMTISLKPFDKNYFIHHENKEIAKLSQELLSSPYEYSEGWITKWQKPLQSQTMPALNFSNDATYAIRRFQLLRLMRLCEQNQQRIKVAQNNSEGDGSDWLYLLKVQQKLQSRRNELAALLNTVVLK